MQELLTFSVLHNIKNAFITMRYRQLGVYALKYLYLISL